MNPTSTTCENTNEQAIPPASSSFRPKSHGPIKTIKMAGSLNSKPTIWCLLRALRKNLWVALLVGLIVGGSVTAAIWFLMPAAKHSVSAKIWLQEVPPRLLFPAEKEPNFDMYRRTQIALIKSRRVLITALDKEEVKKISFIKNSVEPVAEVEKKVKVLSKESPEILEIVVEGDEAEELVTLVNAIDESYQFHFVKDVERLKEERSKELRTLKKAYEMKITAKWEELQELTRDTQAPDVNSMARTQQVALMMLSLAEKELAQVQQQKFKFTVQLNYEHRKYFKDYSVPLYSSPLGGSATPLATAFLLELFTVHTAKTPVQGNVEVPVENNDQLSDFHKRKAELKYLLEHSLGAFNEEKRKEKKAEFEKELNEIDYFIANHQKKLGKKLGLNEAQFESRLDYLKHEVALLTDLEAMLNQEISRQSKIRQAMADATPMMEKIRAQLDNLDKTEKKIAHDLEALEVEKKARSRVETLQGAVIYPPPVIGRKETMMGMGGLGSFFLVLLGFAYLGFRAQKVDSRDQVVQTLGINFIGSVPDFSSRTGLKFLKSRQQEELVRDRMILDSVDAVRTMLLSKAKEEQLKVVMITSALGGEGKTSTAGHLATSLARVGQKTLLIDCDLRNPHIHRLFNVSRGPGMSEVLHGKNDCLGVIQPSFTESLSILSAGDFSTQTLQFFCGEKILEIMQTLKSQFDFIIVDSSPILFVPEAQILSQCSDGVILSVMRNVSRLPKVHSACDLLERLCARNLGFIINGVNDQTYLSSSYYYLPSP